MSFPYDFLGHASRFTMLGAQLDSAKRNYEAVLLELQAKEVTPGWITIELRERFILAENRLIKAKKALEIALDSV